MSVQRITQGDWCIRTRCSLGSDHGDCMAMLSPLFLVCWSRTQAFLSFFTGCGADCVRSCPARSELCGLLLLEKAVKVNAPDFQNLNSNTKVRFEYSYRFEYRASAVPVVRVGRVGNTVKYATDFRSGKQKPLIIAPLAYLTSTNSGTPDRAKRHSCGTLVNMHEQLKCACRTTSLHHLSDKRMLLPAPLPPLFQGALASATRSRILAFATKLNPSLPRRPPSPLVGKSYGWRLRRD